MTIQPTTRQSRISQPLFTLKAVVNGLLEGPLLKTQTIMLVLLHNYICRHESILSKSNALVCKCAVLCCKFKILFIALCTCSSILLFSDSSSLGLLFTEEDVAAWEVVPSKPHLDCIEVEVLMLVLLLLHCTLFTLGSCFFVCLSTRNRFNVSKRESLLDDRFKLFWFTTI